MADGCILLALCVLLILSESVFVYTVGSGNRLWPGNSDERWCCCSYFPTIVDLDDIYNLEYLYLVPLQSSALIILRYIQATLDMTQHIPKWDLPC